MLQADGFTYERKAIEKWLEDHDTSPKTNEPLEHKQLVPNTTLKIAITDFPTIEHERLMRIARKMHEAAPPGLGRRPRGGLEPTTMSGGSCTLCARGPP